MKKLFIIFLLFISLCLLAQNVPQTIDYQGRLADSDGNYLNSVVTVNFLIYDAETGGTALWNESQNVSAANGIFHVLLGSEVSFPADIFNDANRWLELIVSDETLSPRTRIASVPYAIKAEAAYTLQNMGSGSGLDADLLDGQDSSDFMPTTTDSWVNTTGDTMTGELIVQSNVGIGTTTPSTELEVNGVITTSGGNSTNWNTAYSWNNHATAGYLTSSGTITGLVQSTTTGDSYFTGGNFGIGTTSPFSKFQVEDNTPDYLTLSIHNINTSGSERLYFGQSSSEAGIIVWGSTNSSNPGKWRFFNNKTSANYDWVTSGSINMTLNNNGNLGIGVTDPDTKLEVAGQIKLTGGNPGVGKVLTSDANGLASWDGGAYSVGDFALGGVIFWLDETGEHGLVCAKTQSSTREYWMGMNSGFSDLGANGDGLYSGEMNTMITIANQGGDDEFGSYAALTCANAIITENTIMYGDWYLPSKEELNLMYLNRATINATATSNGGSTFVTDYYWSSTEVSTYSAFAQNFGSGYQYNRNKLTYNYYVRAIRAF